MRKLLRSIARARLQSAGYTKFNKKGDDKKSFFSKYWRKLASGQMKIPKRRPVQRVYSSGSIRYSGIHM